MTTRKLDPDTYVSAPKGYLFRHALQVGTRPMGPAHYVRLVNGYPEDTACGAYVDGWERERIQVKELCRKCRKQGGEPHVELDQRSAADGGRI
jgi:hypothetical protein